jgi:hypothetical protein
MVVLFGNLFNNLYVVRHKQDGTELERIKVLLAYSPKEKFVVRLFSDPTLTKSVMTTLPRMSFEIKEYAYDPVRKQSTMQKHSSLNPFDPNKRFSQYVGVPYNITFSLSIYARNIEDGTQIIEQILPYFTPDYTVSATLIEDMDFKKDIPFILTNVSNTIDYEGQIQGVPRLVTWDLTFTAQTWFFGPVANTAIIRGVLNGNVVTGGVTTNIYQSGGDHELQHLTVTKITSHGFMENEYVTVDSRDIVGKILSWSNTANKVVTSPTVRNIEAGDIIRGISSHAYATVNSVRYEQVKIADIHIYQDPITATANDAYGYTTQITEYPDTL